MKTTAAIIAYVAGALLAGAAQADPQQIRLASPAPGPAAINGFFAKWAKDVSDASEGTLVVEFVPGGVLGREGQLLDRVSTGLIDMAWDFQGYYPGKYPRSAVAEQPFQFETSMEGSVALQKIYEAGLLADEYDDVKVVGLFTFPNASLMLKEPIAGLDDLKGRKITAQNPTMQAAAEYLGGVALNLAIPDWYPSLDRGVIDGAIVTFTAVPAFRLNEVMTTFIDIQLGGNPGMFVMNNASYEGLSEKAKSAIGAHSGVTFARDMGAFLHQLNEKSKGIAAQGGNSVIVLDEATAAEWQAKVAPLTETWLAGDPARAAIRDAFLAEVDNVGG